VPIDTASDSPAEVWVYLAAPARLNEPKTFLHCDHSRCIGSRQLGAMSEVPDVAADEAAYVLPDVALADPQGSA
jgi:hypothetical protein